MEKYKLRVGFDFDGVLVYNPLRVLRPFVALFKRIVLGKRKLKFYYPHTRWEKWFWALAHETSIFPAVGFNDLRRLIIQGKIEAFVITARYAYLEKSFWRWLKKNRADKLFSGYYLNKKNEQPHIFKEKIIKKLQLDYYIDDNWDIVNYLNSRLGNSGSRLRYKARFERRTLNFERGQAACEIHWIYNIFDRHISYRHKHPYLKRFLQYIEDCRE